MPLRNISYRRGLTIGTRLIVKGIHNRVMCAEATGNMEDFGQRPFLPKWSFIPSDVRLPFNSSVDNSQSGHPLQ